jgi:hypothetical protein
MVDVSPSGAGLVLSSPFTTGVRVVVDMVLPGGLRMRGAGRVMHTKQTPQGLYRVGVRFDAAPILVDERSDARAGGSSDRAQPADAKRGDAPWRT